MPLINNLLDMQEVVMKIEKQLYTIENYLFRKNFRKNKLEY